uniref:Uncharacterized protein n=1 Tax=Oryza brachyantha TaxID=4533 RepID=J3LPW6_ORYBR
MELEAEEGLEVSAGAIVWSRLSYRNGREGCEAQERGERAATMARSCEEPRIRSAKRCLMTVRLDDASGGGASVASRYP